MPRLACGTVRRILLLLLLVLTVALGCTALATPVPALDHGERGLWVWDNGPTVDPVAQDQLLVFATNNGIKTLYIQAQTLLYDQPTALAELIEHAAKSGLRVELLFGQHTWARAENHQQCLDIAATARKFVADLTTARPVGVHYNIEPHALPEWGTDPIGIANQFLDLLGKLRGTYAGSGLPISIDMPNWYDTFSLSRQGVTRPLNTFVQDIADRTVLMDYRTGVADLVSLAAGEMQYADKIGQPLVIAVETSCDVDPALSYCTLGQAVLRANLDQLVKQESQFPQFSGVAIHHYAAFSTLKP